MTEINDLNHEDDRLEWDDYFMQLAEFVKERSTCFRRKVGAVAVDRRHRVIGTGYNGAPAGMSHCTRKSCIREKLKIPSGQRSELCKAIHAEENIVLQLGEKLEGATLYCTIQPCIMCTKSLIGAGIHRIVWKGDYPDDYARELMLEYGTHRVLPNGYHELLEHGKWAVVDGYRMPFHRKNNGISVKRIRDLVLIN